MQLQVLDREWCLMKLGATQLSAEQQLRVDWLVVVLVVVMADADCWLDILFRYRVRYRNEIKYNSTPIMVDKGKYI